MRMKDDMIAELQKELQDKREQLLEMQTTKGVIINKLQEELKVQC